MNPEDQPLWGARSKLARADKLIAELLSAINQHFKDHPPDIQFSYDPPDDPDALLPKNIRSSTNVKRVPPETGAIVGDIIHNLRAALDLLAIDLVRANRGNEKGVYFPFCASADQLDLMIKQKHFDRAGAKAVAVLKTIEPYAAGNALLRHVHDLDIQDKHRAIIPTTTVAVAGLTVGQTDDGRLRIGPATPQVKVQFPDDCVLAGEPLFPTLVDLKREVTNVVDAFEATLDS
jgi:hypothetical protein